MKRSKNVITNTLIHSQNYSLEDVLQDIFLKNFEKFTGNTCAGISF